MTTKPKPTAGPWVVNGDYVETKMDKFGAHTIAQVDFINPIGMRRANAELIAEAGTVYHETGLTPRELKEHRDRLLESLSDIEALADRETQIKSGAEVDVKELLPDILKLARLQLEKIGDK